MSGAAWDAQIEALPGGRVQRYRLREGAQPMSYAAVIERWQRDAAFREYFSKLLAAAPFATYRWETPPVTRASVGRDFECVLLDSPHLDLPVDPSPFQEHFARAGGESVIAFANLGGDAELIVPCPVAAGRVYGHLGVFVREAPAAQRDALWQRVGAAMQARTGERPVWLSTAGGGVLWLHVRLDAYPKYYGFRPYAAGD